jgi:5-methylcytosine-specific restriction endonuclease McrA
MRHLLQIDHIKPYALGGTHDPENLRVLCAAHNQHEARKTFGERSVPMRN